jgi:hypothetical protein
VLSLFVVVTEDDDDDDAIKSGPSI